MATTPSDRNPQNSIKKFHPVLLADDADVRAAITVFNGLLDFSAVGRMDPITGADFTDDQIVEGLHNALGDEAAALDNLILAPFPVSAEKLPSKAEKLAGKNYLWRRLGEGERS